MSQSCVTEHLQHNPGDVDQENPAKKPCLDNCKETPKEYSAEGGEQNIRPCQVNVLRIPSHLLSLESIEAKSTESLLNKQESFLFPKRTVFNYHCEECGIGFKNSIKYNQSAMYV